METAARQEFEPGEFGAEVEQKAGGSLLDGIERERLITAERDGYVAERDRELSEILYAGTGFLLVRREAYDTIQSALQLPLYNERFGGRPMVPSFSR